MSYVKRTADSARLAAEELGKLTERSAAAEEGSALLSRQLEAQVEELEASEASLTALNYMRRSIHYARMNEKKHADYWKTTIEQVVMLLESIQSDNHILEHSTTQADQ